MIVYRHKLVDAPQGWLGLARHEVGAYPEHVDLMALLPEGQEDRFVDIVAGHDRQVRKRLN